LRFPSFGGSIAWYKVGVVSGSHQSLEMIAGPDCNLAAILQETMENWQVAGSHRNAGRRQNCEWLWKPSSRKWIRDFKI